MSTTMIRAEDCEAAVGIEPTSLKLHIAALEVLEKAGKILDYTEGDYIAAVKLAERKTGLGSVHLAMRGSASAEHVAA